MNNLLILDEHLNGPSDQRQCVLSFLSMLVPDEIFFNWQPLKLLSRNQIIWWLSFYYLAAATLNEIMFCMCACSFLAPYID